MNDQIASRQPSIDVVGQNLEKTTSAGIQASFSDVKEQANSLVVERNNTLLGFLDPRERARRIGESALIRGELAARKEMLQLYHDAQISATREFFQHYLVKLRIRSRAELATYVQEQLLNVEQQTNKILAELEHEIDEEYTRIEAIRIPQVKERRLRDFDIKYNRNFDLINKLFEDFRNAAERQGGM